MPYVDIVKDFSNVPRKIVLGLTKRQLTAVVISAFIGLPLYFLLRPFIGLAAMYLMMALTVPAFLIGFYPMKDGVPIEKRIVHRITARYIRPAKRPYKTDTIYSRMELSAKIQEVIDDAAAERKNKKDKKARPVRRDTKKSPQKNSTAR